MRLAAKLAAVLALALAPVLAPVPAPAGAGAAKEPDAKLAECARIGDNMARLACYDRLAKRRGAAPGDGRDSAWIVQEEEVAGGPDNVYLHVNATAPVTVGWETALPELWLTCAGGVAQIYVNMGVFLHSEKVHLTIRLGRKRPLADTYPVSKDGKTAFLALGDGAAVIARGMAGHDSLGVRAQPYKQKPINVDFPIAGLDRELPALTEACGW
ncbi:MAG: hypothetical protein H6907_13255 [Hyphomicrobiales bacterium]|nr:hypothetical protein [Hyphomicrobiales bacterium]MCP5372693.1 hypothetical protein [Hyphomicrobiales bacterium]